MKTVLQAKDLANFVAIPPSLGDKAIERYVRPSAITRSGDGKQAYTAVMSSAISDHDHTVIVPRGIDTALFATNPVLIWAHDYTRPAIGRVENIRLSEDGKALLGDLVFADTEFAREIESLVAGGFLKAVSVGLIPTKVAYPGEEAYKAALREYDITKPVSRIIVESTLLELSVCNIPCNPEALIRALNDRSISISDDTRALLPLSSEAKATRMELLEIWSALQSLKNMLDDTIGQYSQTASDLVDMITAPAEIRPYPNEHAARQLPPDLFKPDTFRRVNNKFGDGIHAIFGQFKDSDKWGLQSIRFDATKWSPEEAKKWLKDHDFKADEFEEATGEHKQQRAMAGGDDNTKQDAASHSSDSPPASAFVLPKFIKKIQ